MDAPLTLEPAPPRDTRVVVGLSGGRDSIVLLHLLAATPSIAGLRALHVHHGLHDQADTWTAHCEATCADLRIALTVARVVVEPRGEGLEAAARHARLAAFADAMHDGEWLALAHHRDDQAETFLLRALRASGPDGLGAMRPLRPFGPGHLWRPLLQAPRAALEAYAREHALAWVDDPANDALEQDRNFLRHRVLPLLRERWPHADASLARAAALNADAAALLASEDARALDDARTDDPAIVLAAPLRALDPARRARVLRRWVATLGLPPLPAEGVARVGADLDAGAPDADFAFAWSGAELRRWRDRLRAVRAAPPPRADWEDRWDGRLPLVLPDGGTLALEGADAFDAPLRVRLRRGGERIALPGRTHTHSLKHALQDAGVPAWDRVRMPLLLDAADDVLAAGDRLLAAPFAAWLRERDAALRWMPPPSH